MPIAERKVPTRRCSGCGEHFPKAELVRIVRTPEGEIILDKTGKANGRGAYLCNKAGCLALARKKRRIETALESQIPADIYDRLEEEIGHEN